MGQKLFKEDAFDEECQFAQAELLSTIRVPRNLLYLTDKLPKPIYGSSSRNSNSPGARPHREEGSRRGNSHPRKINGGIKKNNPDEVSE